MTYFIILHLLPFSTVRICGEYYLLHFGRTEAEYSQTHLWKPQIKPKLTEWSESEKIPYAFKRSPALWRGSPDPRCRPRATTAVFRGSDGVTRDDSAQLTTTQLWGQFHDEQATLISWFFFFFFLGNIWPLWWRSVSPRVNRSVQACNITPLTKALILLVRPPNHANSIQPNSAPPIVHHTCHSV